MSEILLLEDAASTIDIYSHLMTFLRLLARRLQAIRPQTQDLLLSIAVAAMTLAIGLPQSVADNPTFSDSASPSSVAGIALLASPSALLVLRRRWPVPVLLLATVLQMVVWALGFAETMIATTILIAGASYYGGKVGRRRAVQVAIALTLWTLVGVVSGSAPVLAIPTVGFYGAFAATFGRYVASQTALAEAVEEIGQEMQHRQRADAERFRHEERNKLARELHDVVAHNLSVIVVHAGAARRVGDAAKSKESIELIEATARTAIDEMRDVLGALRTSDEAGWEPTQSLEDIDHLVEQMEVAGLTIRSAVDDPAGLALPILVSGYRLVQEALTNCLKHAGHETMVDLTIQRTDALLEIVVSDDGGQPDGRIAGDPGHGLRGMKERVELLGGRFEAGQRSAGGFEVRIALPLNGGRA